MLYPSGFVGSNTVDLGLIEASQTHMSFHVGMIKTKTSDQKEKPYCKNTDLLYTQYQGKNINMAQATMLMSIAYKHIGSTPLQWLKRHAEPEYTKYSNTNRYHIEFLCESIKIALGNGTRRFSNISWRKYLESNSTDFAWQNSSTYKELISDKQFIKMTSSEFIANWIASPGGQQDLLESLNMMYGKH
jgi:hypothetical protein